MPAPECLCRGVVRVLTCTALLYEDLLRAAPTVALPPVLPLVLYHGSKWWTAPAEVAGLAAPLGAFVAPYQPSQRYMLLDFGGYTDPTLPSGRNLVAALMRLQRSRSPQEEESALEALAEWLWETGNEALVRAVGTWMRQVYLPGRPEDEALPRLGSPREGATMLYAEPVREWISVARHE